MEFIPYNEMIFLMDKLDASDQPIPFSFTCSTAKGTFLSMKRAVKSMLADKPQSKKKTFHPSTQHSASKKVKKMHVNIKDLDTGNIKTIYPRTISLFNGYKVSPEL